MTTRPDFLSKNQHVVDSAVSVVKHDEFGNIINSSLIGAPLGNFKDINNSDIKVRLYELLYRCLK